MYPSKFPFVCGVVEGIGLPAARQNLLCNVYQPAALYGVGITREEGAYIEWSQSLKNCVGCVVGGVFC